MERAGEFLGRAVRRLGDPAAALAWLTAAWSEIAGPALAAHTRPMRCEKNRLEIAADGKTWRRQIEGMSREFCARINQEWGAALVHEVKFTDELPAESSAFSPAEDNTHIPFVHRRKSP